MKQILIFISLFFSIVYTSTAQSVTANQFNGRLQMTTVSNVSDSTWSITGYFTNSVNKYTTTQIAVNDRFFCQIGANTYVGRISVINSASDVTKLITFRVICNYPNPPNNIGAIIRATSNGYPVFVDGLPNALQAGIQNYFATLINTNAAGSPCEQTITQSAHGFRDFTPVRWNSNTSRYERSTNDTIVPDYIVVDSLTANTFKVANCGTYTTALTNGLYWFTSASPGYSLTADTTKVPLFQVLNGKLILNPIVGFNLMSGGGSGDVTLAILADTAAAIRADFPSGSGITALTGDVTASGTGSVAATIATGAVGSDELASTAVAAGSYTSANITVDADGRLTSAANGSGGVTSTEGYVGDIYNVSSWTDTVGWTKTATTVALGSGKLSFSAGVNDYTHRFKFDQPHAFEKWQWEVKTITTQKDATSYGYAFGTESSNSTSANKYGLAVRFIGQTGADQGKIQLVSITGAANTATILTTSTTALTYSANDTIIINVRREYGQLTAEAWNATTNSGRVSIEYNYAFTTSSTVIGNTGNFTIFSIGGTFEVLDTKLTSREITNPALVFMADSKFVGYGANEQRYRAADLVKPTFGSVVVASGGGDKTAELLTTVGYSARKIRPQVAIVSIGSNDVRLGVSSATYIANYDRIVDTLESLGITVYHAPLYESSAPITTLYNYIVATYPTSKVLPTYEITSAYLSADNVHPSEVGNQRIANIIISKDSLPVGKNNGIDKPLSGSVPSGGLVAYSSAGNILKGGANDMVFNPTTISLGIGGAGSYAVHGVATGATAGFDYFRLDDPTVVGDVRFGSFGSLWNNGVSTETLHGINWNSSIVMGVGTASSTAFQLRAVGSGSSITFGDRGAKTIMSWTSAGGTSSAMIVGGNAYAGFSNQNGSNFPISAGLGSGTGTTGDLIFQTGTAQASGTTDHVKTNRWWLKGETGRLGMNSSPTAWLHPLASTTASATLRIPTGTAPTSPNEGDIWQVSNDLHFYTASTDAILARVLKGSNTLDFGSTAAGAVTDLTITVTGAADGDVVSLSVPNASQTTTGSFSAWVSATNTVTVRYRIAALVGSEDPASGTFKVTVTK